MGRRKQRKLDYETLATVKDIAHDMTDAWMTDPEACLAIFDLVTDEDPYWAVSYFKPKGNGELEDSFHSPNAEHVTDKPTDFFMYARALKPIVSSIEVMRETPSTGFLTIAIHMPGRSDVPVLFQVPDTQDKMAVTPGAGETVTGTKVVSDTIDAAVAIYPFWPGENLPRMEQMANGIWAVYCDKVRALGVTCQEAEELYRKKGGKQHRYPMFVQRDDGIASALKGVLERTPFELGEQVPRKGRWQDGSWMVYCENYYGRGDSLEVALEAWRTNGGVERIWAPDGEDIPTRIANDIRDNPFQEGETLPRKYRLLDGSWELYCERIFVSARTYAGAKSKYQDKGGVKHLYHRKSDGLTKEQ